MKRTKRKQPSLAGKPPVTIDRIRLAAARGGGLDIAVRIAVPLAPDMSFQHNERLVAA